MTRDRLGLFLFVTDFRFGGTERQVVALGCGLDGDRFERHVACLKRNGQFLDELAHRGIPVLEYSIDSLYSLRSFRERSRLARDLRRQRIQVVHAFGFYSILFAIPAARLAGVPAIIASVRDMGDIYTPSQRRAQKIVCRLAHRVQVNAKAVADRLAMEGYARRRIEIIPNGIDLSRFVSRVNGGNHRRELGLPPEAPLVALISRLSRVRGIEIKGARHFLEAAAVLARQFDEARFIVVGEGEHREELERYAERLGLGRRALFTGFRADIPALLSNVSVSVVPSLTEGLSNSLLESMAACVPVVATRVGGNPELVEDGVTGLLVPPADPDALARAVGLLLAYPALGTRLAQAGRRLVTERFSLERMVEETERLYGVLMEESAARMKWRRARPWGVLPPRLGITSPPPASHPLDGGPAP